MNGTKIEPSEIILNKRKLEYIYKTDDGQYVTPGKNPSETEKILHQYGNGKFTKIYASYIQNLEGVNTYQIVYKSKSNPRSHEIAIDIFVDWILYPAFGGDKIRSSVWSGNQLDTLLDNLNTGSNAHSILQEFKETPYLSTNALDYIIDNNYNILYPYRDWKKYTSALGYTEYEKIIENDER